MIRVIMHGCNGKMGQVITGLCKEDPDVEIVARQAGDTLEGGMKIVESVLAQTPDLNVVVGTNDSGAIGG